MSVQARTYHHELKRATLEASATKWLKTDALPCSDRSLTSDARIQPTPMQGKGLSSTPTSSSGGPDPGRINLFHRLGVGSFPERARLSADLLPMILERFAECCPSGSLSARRILEPVLVPNPIFLRKLPVVGHCLNGMSLDFGDLNRALASEGEHGSTSLGALRLSIPKWMREKDCEPFAPFGVDPQPQQRYESSPRSCHRGPAHVPNEGYHRPRLETARILPLQQRQCLREE